MNICTEEILRLLQGRQLWSHSPRAVKWGRMSFLVVGNCGWRGTAFLHPGVAARQIRGNVLETRAGE